LSKKRKRREEEFFEEPDFDYDQPPEPVHLPRKKVKITQLLDPAKVAQLLRAQHIQIKEKPKEKNPAAYRTYTQEEVVALLRAQDSDPEST